MNPGVFIDNVDDGKARVLDPSGAARTVAVNDLPPAAGEGATVADGKILPPGPDPAAATRAALGAGDPGGTIDLSAPTGPSEAGVDAVSGGAPVPPAPPPSPGQAYIDSVIQGTDRPATETPPAPVAAPLGKDGLPASSADLQQRIQQGIEGEKKALEGVQQAQEEGRDKVQAEIDKRDDLLRQQQADEAAQRQYVRDRDEKLNQEDAANLQKARDTVIPDFWESRQGQMVGAAITVGISGFFGGALAGATGQQPGENQALKAIQHNVDSYYTQQRQKIDDLYKYAEAKGQLNDKMRHQYASELTDLMQQHAYTLQAAADRIKEVSDLSKGLVDQKQVEVQMAQLQGRAADELQKAREIDTKNYDLQTHRMIAEADMLKARAAAAKAHKGAGGGASAGDWRQAMIDASQQPGATVQSIAKAAVDAGYRGKDAALNTAARAQMKDVEGQVGKIEAQMHELHNQVEQGGKGPGPQLQRIGGMRQELQNVIASGDPGKLKEAITNISEEAGGMLRGGTTTETTMKLLHGLQSLGDEVKAKWSKVTGHPTEGRQYADRLVGLLGGVAEEKRSILDQIRKGGVDQTLGPGGTAASPAMKRQAMARFKKIFSQTDESGKPYFDNEEHGGAKPAAAPAATPAGPSWKPIPKALAGNPALAGKKEVLVDAAGNITDAR